MRRTDDVLKSCVEWTSAICVNSCHVIKLNVPACRESDYLYTLALLNSRLLQKVFALNNPQMMGKTFAEIKVIYVARLPIRIMDLETKSDNAKYSSIVTLTKTILSQHKSLAAAKTPHEKSVVQTQINAMEMQIDNIVYELYGLTDEEIRIVLETTMR